MYITLGILKGKKIRTYRKAPYRPTPSKLREAFFQSKYVHVQDKRFLDVFAGTGIMGFYALSCGAEFVAFVDQNKAVCKVLKENIRMLDLMSRAFVIQGKAESVFQRTSPRPYDIIYFSPPYRYRYEKFAQIFELGYRHGWWDSRSILFVQRFKKTPPPDVLLWTRVTCIESGEHRIDMYIFEGVKQDQDVHH